MPTFFERRQLVIIGDLLAEGEYIAGENTYLKDNNIYASRIGVVEYENNKVNVVALKAFYAPSVGDTIIGIASDVGFAGWTVDINAPYQAFLRASDVIGKPFKPQQNDLSQFLSTGDLIVAKITSFDRTRDPHLTVNEPGLGKITRGQIIKITPTKIPRVIGRKGSMISVIKQHTNCEIIIGLNGVILVTGKSRENEELAIMAINKIEIESHTSGLTDRITQLLKAEKEKREEIKNEPKTTKVD